MRTDLARLSRRAALVAAAGLSLTACARRTEPALAGPPLGRVVLLRGLANIFSTGMDTLETKLRMAGYDASSHSHVEWRGQADAVLEMAQKDRLPRPFAVIGHSLGADDGIRLAAEVGRAARVADLLVTFDPVMVGAVPAGPAFVRNYYQTSGAWGRGLQPGQGFAGVLENRVVTGDNHFTIDKDPGLHAEVIGLLQAMRDRVGPAGDGAPVPGMDEP